MVKGFDPRVPWGLWGLGLSSACLAAVAYLATMKCRDTDHPVGVVIWFHLLAVPVMGTLSWGNWSPMTDMDLGLALAIGVLSIAAQVLMTVALHNEDAGMVMPFKYLGAVLALAIGWWGYGESMSTMSLAGMALVVASISANTVLTARRSASAACGHLHAHPRTRQDHGHRGDGQGWAVVHAKDIEDGARCIQRGEGPSLAGLVAGKATHHPGAEHHAQPCREQATCVCGRGQGRQKFTHVQGVIHGRTGNAFREAVLQCLSESPTHQGAGEKP